MFATHSGETSTEGSDAFRALTSSFYFKNMSCSSGLPETGKSNLPTLKVGHHQICQTRQITGQVDHFIGGSGSLFGRW